MPLNLEEPTHDLDFSVARAAIAHVLPTTQAAAGEMVKLLTPTQLERVVGAARGGKSEEHSFALVKIALAMNLAEQSAAKAHEAETLVHRLAAEHGVSQAAEDLTAASVDLANQAEAQAADAVKAVDALAAPAPATDPAIDPPADPSSNPSPQTNQLDSEPSADAPPQAAPDEPVASEPPAEASGGDAAAEGPTA